MSGGPMKLIETHIEKGVLGLAALGLLAMAFFFLIRSPNTVEFNNEPLGAGELDESIKKAADGLDAALRNAKPPETSVEDSSRELAENQAAGIGGGSLRLAADFGTPIPTIRDEEDSSSDIVLVTPLKPAPPVLRTGRSEVIRRPETLTLGPTTQPATPEAGGADPNGPKPVELPWVSVATYFSRKSQQEEMIKARYATSKSKVYLAGMDVQRQEMLASGEFSDWQDVVGSKAMPKLDIPEPVFDDVTGQIKNDPEVKEAWAFVKSSQTSLVQPEFYEVEAGDTWEMPPLAGYEDIDEPAEEPKTKVAKAEAPKAPPPPRPKPGRSTGVIGGGGRSTGVIGGGGVISGGGKGRPAPAKGATDATRQAKKDGEARGKQDLTAAREAYSKRSYAEAQQAAQRVVDNEYARQGDKNQAKKVLRLAEKKAGQDQHASGGAPSGVVSSGSGAVVVGSGGPVVIGGSGRTAAPTVSGGPSRPVAPTGRPGLGLGSSSTAQPGVLVTDPDDSEKVAVWFHDDTVEAGKTYRYRMRVKIWNRYVGRMKALKSPEQAKHTLLAGDWSLPSQAVTVAPSTHFFVTGMTSTKTAARIDIWKWHKGDWLRESFDVAVGDLIGSVRKAKTGELDEDGKEVREDVDFITGAIVLDVRPDEPVTARSSAGKEGQFSLRDRKSLVVVYLDPADGQVKQRVADFDRYDPLYQKLKEES